MSSEHLILVVPFATVIVVGMMYWMAHMGDRSNIPVKLDARLPLALWIIDGGVSTVEALRKDLFNGGSLPLWGALPFLVLVLFGGFCMLAMIWNIAQFLYAVLLSQISNRA